MDHSVEEYVLPDNLDDLDGGSRFSADEDNVSNSNDFDELCGRDLDADELELGESEGSNWTLNRNYRTVLQELRRNVISDLQRCKDRQAIIENRIQELITSAVKPLSRKNWFHLFGYPYFKDRHFFPCPINDDCKEKRSKNEIDYHQLPPIRRWVEYDCSKLEEAVKANAIEMKTSELMKQQGIVLQNLKNPNIKRIEKENLSKKLIAINHEIESVKYMAPSVLYGDKNRPFDWLKITAEAFGELRSSEEVQAMWVLCRHPSVNRRHWTNAENEKLKEIAIRNKEQDWAKIAAELNTNRSEFQCIIQYQRHVNTDLINHKWTDAEDEMLKFLVEKCRVGDFIPWATVTMCMSNRTRTQVYNRWQNSANPLIKKGRFTTEEDCLIMAGVNRFGKDFTHIASLLPGRTTTQIYARYTQCLVRIGPLGRWTKEEDAQLIKLVEEDGCTKWHELTKYFKHRSRNQIRHRYRFLNGWLSKNPHVSIGDAPRRDLGDCSQRNSILWSKIQKALESSLKEKKVIGDIVDLNDDDLAALKMTMSPNINKGKAKIGRKQKPFSKADKLLDEFGRVSYLLSSGRRKVLFNEEDKQRRFGTTMKILLAIQAHLSFQFDESAIEEDDCWNDADLFILLELKKMFDERIQAMEHTSNESSSVECSSAQCLVNAKHVGIDVVQTFNQQNLLPFHSSKVQFCLPFPEVFPCNLGNIVGFRTLLLSRNNLKMWKATPKRDVIALPPWRPPNLRPGEKTVKRLTKEESSKIFAERLFVLFMWSSNLARMQPNLKRDTYETEEPTAPVPAVVEQPKLKRRKTIRHVAKAKKKMMKKRWMEQKEEKRRCESDEKADSRKKARLNSVEK